MISLFHFVGGTYIEEVYLGIGASPNGSRQKLCSVLGPDPGHRGKVAMRRVQ